MQNLNRNTMMALVILASFFSTVANSQERRGVTGSQRVTITGTTMINNNHIRIDDRSTTVGGVHSLSASVVSINTPTNTTVLNDVTIAGSTITNNGDIIAVSSARVNGGIHRACASILAINC